MSLATLSIDLEARLAKFTQDMGQAARVTEKSAAQMSAALGVVRASIGGLAAGITFGGLIALTKNAINSLDALNDLRDATGASVENLSALEDVAARTGASFEDVSTGLVKFNGLLKDAKPGTDSEAAFRALNLNVEELKRLDPAEALRQTAVALAGFADDSNKGRLQVELFGKSTQKMSAYLKDLAEQSELVAKVTSQETEEAEKFNKELFRLQKNLQDVTRELTGPLIAGMNGLIAKFREGSTSGDGFAVTLLKQTELARLLGLSGAGKGFDGAGRNSGLFALTGSTAIGSGGYDRSATRLTRQSGKPSIEFDGKTPTPKKTPVQKEVKDLDLSNKALVRYLETLENSVQKTQDLSNQEQALLFLRKEGAGATLDQAAAVLKLAKALDAEAEQNERIAIGRQSAIDQGVDNTAYQAQLKGLLDATESGKIRATAADIAILAEEFQRFIDSSGAAGISQEQYIEAVQARIGGISEEVKKVNTFAQDMGLTFSSAFEKAIIGGGKFSDVLKGLGQDILQITVRKSITEPLGGFFTKALSGLLSFDGGGSTGGGARAGGLDGKGGFLGVLHPRETVIDHTKGGGGAVVININQQVGDIATVSMLQRNNTALIRQIQAGIGRSQGYGGALA